MASQTAKTILGFSRMGAPLFSRDIAEKLGPEIGIPDLLDRFTNGK